MQVLWGKYENQKDLKEHIQTHLDDDGDEDFGKDVTYERA